MYTYPGTFFQGNTVKEMRDHLWKAFGLDNRAIVFFAFDTEYGKGTGRGYASTAEEMFDDMDWFRFCANEAPNVCSIYVKKCVSVTLGNGKPEFADSDDVAFLTSIMRDNPELFMKAIEKYGHVSSRIEDEEVANPNYDVLGNIEEDE